MSSLIHLSAAIVLAIAAAGANWVYLAAQTAPPAYVAVKSSVREGQTIEDELLAAVPVPGDAERLRQALVPYRNRSILLGTRASRDYESGDMIFARDLTPPPDGGQWDVIGPFELISVGERFKSGLGPSEVGSSTVRGDTVTIAVASDFDRHTSRLLEAISADRGSSGRKNLEIVAIQVVPSQRPRLSATGVPQRLGAATDPSEDASRNDREVVYQTVSLEGIPNVPVVLLEGDLIRFVVPRLPGA